MVTSSPLTHLHKFMMQKGQTTLEAIANIKPTLIDRHSKWVREGRNN